MNVSELKKELRAEMRMKRRGVPAASRISAGKAISKALLRREDVCAVLAKRGCVCVYLASKDELPLDDFVAAAWEKGATVVVPAWNEAGKKYELVRYSRETVLTEGPHSILEPVDGTPCGVEPALWIVPGLAFDEKGGRLGYGGGWYDRFLADNTSGTVLGVAYSFQIVTAVPREEHDRPLDGVVRVDAPIVPITC